MAKEAAVVGTLVATIVDCIFKSAEGDTVISVRAYRSFSDIDSLRKKRKRNYTGLLRVREGK